MYNNYFGFRDKPFNLVPNPAYLYLSSRHSLALTYLEYGIQENIGFVLLTGEVGAGKTTLIRYLLNTMSISFDVAVISNTNVSAQELVKLILQELEIEPVSEYKSQNLDRLNNYLLRQYSSGKRVVLILDEAQNLCREAIEEVRMLSNLSTDTGSLLQIILVGQPELRYAIQQDDFKQLAQRIAINHHLQGLERQEVDNYIKHRITRAKGEEADLFDPQAVEYIYEHSGGIPRMINVLCDACLVYAYADGEERITPEIVEQVIQDRGEEWGNTEQVGVTQADQEISSDARDAQKDIQAPLEDMRQNLNRLQFRVESLENELKNRDHSAKDNLVSWLEQRLNKVVKEVKYLREVNAKQEKEIERLQETKPQIAMDSATENKGVEEESTNKAGEETANEQTFSRKSPKGRKIVFTLTGIFLVALLLHFYFGILV